MTKDLAKAAVNTIASIPSTSEFDDDEEIKLRLSIFCDRRGKRKGVATQAIYGEGPKVARWVDEEIEPLVDMRKAQKGSTITIGSVTITGDGEVTDFDVDDEYLKPSEVKE